MSLIKKIKNKIKVQAQARTKYQYPFFGNDFTALKIMGHKILLLKGNMLLCEKISL